VVRDFGFDQLFYHFEFLEGGDGCSRSCGGSGGGSCSGSSTGSGSG
jgi:hypothetical protein